MPMSSRLAYDNHGNPYNVTKILNDDATLNLMRYEAYSPLFISTTFAVSYGLSFASITGQFCSPSSVIETLTLFTATLTHTFLYFRKQIALHARRSLSEQPDIHAKLMSKYTPVPDWWYMLIFGSSKYH